jgi:hypothetical protein
MLSGADVDHEIMNNFLHSFPGIVPVFMINTGYALFRSELRRNGT